ncbi:hypothetical protein HK101_011965 [Irineochytrium annulatum]|nr:hypothetical protein HK101_011965 [Irineochytrium annulatum]
MTTTHWDKDTSAITGMSSLEAFLAWLKDGNAARLIGAEDKGKPHRKDKPNKATLFKECEEYLKNEHGLNRFWNTIQSKYNSLLRSYRAARDIKWKTGEGLEDGAWDLMDDAEKEKWKEDWLGRERTLICKDYDALDKVFGDAGGQPTCVVATGFSARDLDASVALRTQPALKVDGVDTKTPLRCQSLNNDTGRTNKRAKVEDEERDREKEKDKLAEVGAMILAMREREAVERARVEEKRLEIEERRLQQQDARDRALQEKENRREERQTAVKEGKLGLMWDVELKKAVAAENTCPHRRKARDW